MLAEWLKETCLGLELLLHRGLGVEMLGKECVFSPGMGMLMMRVGEVAASRNHPNSCHVGVTADQTEETAVTDRAQKVQGRRDLVYLFDDKVRR